MSFQLKILFMIGVLGGALFGLERARAASDLVRLESRRTHSRLAFRLTDTAVTEFKATDQGFEVLLKGFSLMDLGAPQGQTSPTELKLWRQNFGSLSDQRLSDVQFSETSEGVKVTGVWHFPEGKDALVNPKMETFAYREKQPARYVIDFWVKPGQTKAEHDKEQVKVRVATHREGVKRDAEMRTQARLAKTDQKQKEEDLTRFCQEPLFEDNDIVLPFRPFHERLKMSRWFSGTTPDETFTYYEPSSDDREAQYVRLAIKLYRQGNLALALKTLDFLDAEFPKSPFKTEMRFLKANAFLKLNMRADADRILLSLMMEGKRAPVALHSGMYMASRLYAENNHLAAMESFLWLAKNYPEHRLLWVFHLGAGESLFALRQTERAFGEYRWVVENAPEVSAKAEAAFRIGDLYLDRFQYEQSLAAYYEALQKFPEMSKSFAPVAINRAESLYGLAQYDAAEKAFKEFLKKFPGHPAGWRATYRLGEIAARKVPLTEATRQASRKSYYETINHFPFSPGSTLARLRLAPCGDQAGFDDATADQFFTVEAKKFTGLGEMPLTRYSDMRAISYVRTLVGFEELEQAVDAAVDEISVTREPKTRQILGTLLNRVFRKRVIQLLDEKNPYQALKYYHAKAGEIPKEALPANPDYLLRLSQGAADLGLGSMAKALATTFERDQTLYLRRLDRGVAAALPEAGFEKRLIESEQAFTRAKAEWVKLGVNLGKKPSEQEEREIRSLLDKVAEESPNLVYREVMLGMLSEMTDQFKEARSHAIRAQFLIGKKRDSREIEAWAMRLEKKYGDPDVAIKLTEGLMVPLPPRAPAANPSASPSPVVSPSPVPSSSPSPREELSEARILGLPPAPTPQDLWLAQAELLEKKKKWVKAVEVYDRLVEEGFGGNQAKYGLAKCLLELGEVGRNRALQVLDALVKLPGEDFWKRLAKERLENEMALQPPQN